MSVLVLRNIATHFQARSPEWVTGVGLSLWGASLIGPDQVFARPGFANLAALADETTWGFVALTVGIVRILALFVNGSFEGFQYSPHLRALTGFISCFVWTSIWIGLVTSSPTGRIVYLMLLAIEIINVWRALGDMGAQRGQKNANTAP